MTKAFKRITAVKDLVAGLHIRLYENHIGGCCYSILMLYGRPYMPRKSESSLSVCGQIACRRVGSIRKDDRYYINDLMHSGHLYRFSNRLYTLLESIMKDGYNCNRKFHEFLYGKVNDAQWTSLLKKFKYEAEMERAFERSMYDDYDDIDDREYDLAQENETEGQEA